MEKIIISIIGNILVLLFISLIILLPFLQLHGQMQVDYNKSIFYFLYFYIAHRHGVLCLGTIITEWQDGARLCAQLLSNEHLMETFVQQIIAITQYYQFDGWLVNIENPVHVSYNNKID